MNLAFDDRGSGDPVLFIAGRGGAGRTWHLHQVPVFTRAGYRCVTFDNRGIGATENASGFTTETMVGDTAALIEHLGLAPVRIVALSMGSYIAQELMVARPELVKSAVLMATRGRHDRTRDFFWQGEHALADPDLYSRDPAKFAQYTDLLDKLRAEKDAAEERWLELAEMVEP